MKEVTFLEVKSYTCKCPYCGETLDGFYGDARGDEVECDFCDETFLISQHADYEVF